MFKQISTKALIGQAVRLSVPKLMPELRNALGGMLYIARAERLATSSPYAREVLEALGDVLAIARPATGSAFFKTTTSIYRGNDDCCLRTTPRTSHRRYNRFFPLSYSLGNGRDVTHFIPDVCSSRTAR